MNWAWPAALAFVGMCAAIAWSSANQPPSKNSFDVEIECIKAKGEVNGWGHCNIPRETTK